ncbi:hypothetical protein [Micromonospora sp. DT233]|uniref:hypothetical protein n=1 Tax=Micromonospora sp. DT233 TaxID=3393432 RepID=UPI003CEE8E55
MPVPTPHAIVVVDIEGFGRRSNPMQASLRTAMYEVVQNAFADVNLSWGDVFPQDRGDGILMLVPASVSTVVLAGDLVRALDAGLREKARIFTQAHAMRFRVALHQGLCQPDGKGWVGEAINTASRLVDAQPLRLALAAAPRATLAFVVSDEIHRSVIRHDYRFIDSSTFASTRIDMKELRGERVWIQVPGYPHPPGLPDEEPEPDRPVDGDGDDGDDGDGDDGDDGDDGPGSAPLPGPDQPPPPAPPGQSGGINIHNSDVRVRGNQAGRDMYVDGRAKRGRR